MDDSNRNPQFRDKFAEDIFNHKYAHEGAETWDEMAKIVVNTVCEKYLKKDELDQLEEYVRDMKFIPGGRYLYYAGREAKFYNNCFLLAAEEDTREDWAALSWKNERALMTGGGIGTDYSVYRASGSPLGRTGGIASGPISKIEMTNEQGRRIMQGGSRRSAIYASLSCDHGDVHAFLKMKDWDNQPVAGTGGLSVGDLKRADFNYHAPCDMTNCSVNYGTAWLEGDRLNEVFLENVRMAMRTAEPGFSFNFHNKENETLRNACCEISSEDDSDVCNLGSLNFGRIENLTELRDIVRLATKFLICGTLEADLPYDKIYKVREKNRRLGLGIMGMHEWLVSRRERYEVTPELKEWLNVYETQSDSTSESFSRELSVSQPVASRAIAPTGSLSILASTSGGIEPIFATAFKRRYLKGGDKWHYQYVVDSAASTLIDQYGVDPDSIETALDLANEYERRIAFQADVQDHVDMCISSTINMPAWGSELNNEDTIMDFAKTLADYAPRLRGFTCYPDGARGGQPLTAVPYAQAKANLGQDFEEAVQTNDICDITGKGGSCGV